jgi:methyl-CpG-binding domain protein 4
MIEDQRDTMIQEIYKEDPWKMLVCCIFLNMTTRDQLDKIRVEFFERYPDAISIVESDYDELSNMIEPLGFKNKRTETLKRFSYDWLNVEWTEPIELYGIGKYGQDSWEIFQKGNLDVSPSDGALLGYLKKLKQS